MDKSVKTVIKIAILSFLISAPISVIDDTPTLWTDIARPHKVAKAAKKKIIDKSIFLLSLLYVEILIINRINDFGELFKPQYLSMFNEFV